MGGMARAIGTTRTPHAAQHMDAPHTHRTGCSAGGRSREGAAMNLWLSMRCAASKYTDAQRKEVQRRGGVPSAQGQAQGDRPLASRFGAAAAAARRSARGPHAPRSGSRARTAATSDASAETSGVSLGLKSASDLCLEAWTTRVASGPGAVGVPRPPRAGRGRG